MPNQNQINFIKLNKDLITTPILIIGSKEYDFDEYNYIQELNRLGFDDGDGAGNEFFGKVKQLQIFKTALSDSELATLTT